MDFGAPTRSADKATFYTPPLSTSVGADEDGVPFDPDAPRAVTHTGRSVPCAIEYLDRADINETFGAIQASRIKITLLDPDYQKVKGFTYVVVGGEKYMYRLTEPPVALGSIDVWTVQAVAEDEA